MYQLTLLDGGKVYSAVMGDPQPNGVEVSQETYEQFLAKPIEKDAFYINGAIEFRDKQYTDAEVAAAARGKRDMLLAECDWTQMPDVTISNKQAWADYRQQLRDITSQPGFPRDIVWPEKP